MEPFTLIEGPEAWYAADYKGRTDWINHLSAQHVQELDAAVSGIMARRIQDIHVSGMQEQRREHERGRTTTVATGTKAKQRKRSFMEHVLSLIAPLQTVTKADFPLPTLGPYLESVRDEVVSGRGFALIRGVPVDRWVPEGLFPGQSKVDFSPSNQYWLLRLCAATTILHHRPA